MEKEKKRVNWSELEINYFFKIMRDKNILDMLDTKGHRNADIFKIVEGELKKRGFLKSLIQIRTKWKALKLQYYKTRRANSISSNDRMECPFWNELDELLGHRPACNVDTSYGLVLDDAENSEGDVITPEVVMEVEPTAGSSKQQEPDREQGPVRKKIKAEGDVITPEVVMESEPTAGSSKQHEPDREQGPVRKKIKVEKKGGFSEALKAFSKDIKESQKEIAHMFLEKQAELFAKDLEEQRQWEQKLLEEDRVATERMITNLMSSFFHNLRQAFFNPSQAPTLNSVPVPFPSPVSPTINSPPPQAPSIPNCVPLPCPSPVSPTIPFPTPQAPLNQNGVPLPYPSAVSPTIPLPPPRAPSNPNLVPLPHPSLESTSETQFSTQADGLSTPERN